MSGGEGTKDKPAAKSPIYFEDLGWGMIAIFSGMAAVFSAAVLLAGTVHLGALYATYLLYAVALFVFLHAGFFLLVRFLEDDGKQLSRRVPKYLEYAYAAILCVSLAQIFFAAPLFKDYVAYVVGDDEILLEQVRMHVKKHVEVDCAKPSKYFTPEYCARMKTIHDRAQATELKDRQQAEEFKSYLVREIAPDTAFLTHVTDRTIVPVRNRETGVDFVEFASHSPIGAPIAQLATKHSYANVQPGGIGESIFRWLGLFFLPLAIALRVVKTSLELFVEMA